MPSGTQQFDLDVYDNNYPTGDPAAPLVGTNIHGTVTVTINWNPAGTDLADGAVSFSPAQWDVPGCGPLTVYSDAMGGGVQPVGAVAWTIKTSFQKTAEQDTPNKRFRWIITPQVELVRTFTSTIGDPNETGAVFTATDNAKGGWLPQP
jgi:hypothetical protein